MHLQVSTNNDSLVRPIIANGGSQVHFCETDKTTLACIQVEDLVPVMPEVSCRALQKVSFNQSESISST